MTRYSAENPAEVSPECYKDIETQLELWYNSEGKPYRYLFEQGKRVNQKYIVKKFDLIIEDYLDTDNHIEVRLQSKENPDLIVYREVFDKTFGCIK